MGSINRKIVIQAGLGINVKPYLKKQEGMGAWVK
jgi:hypothetical protein